MNNLLLSSSQSQTYPEPKRDLAVEVNCSLKFSKLPNDRSIADFRLLEIASGAGHIVAQ